MLHPADSDGGCPIHATSLFLSLGWETTTPPFVILSRRRRTRFGLSPPVSPPTPRAPSCRLLSVDRVGNHEPTPQLFFSSRHSRRESPLVGDPQTPVTARTVNCQPLRHTDHPDPSFRGGSAPARKPRRFGLERKSELPLGSSYVNQKINSYSFRKFSTAY